MNLIRIVNWNCASEKGVAPTQADAKPMNLNFSSRLNFRRGEFSKAVFGCA